MIQKQDELVAVNKEIEADLAQEKDANQIKTLQILGLETENKKLRCDLNKIQQNMLMGNETIQNNDQSRAECNSTMDTRRNLEEDEVRVLNRRIMELERTSTFNNYRKAPIPVRR